MNFFNRVFCRVYQGAFRAALPILPYRTPKILNSVLNIPDEIKRLKLNSALLITDKFFKDSGLTDSVEKALAENGICCTVYDGTRANPTVKNVEDAYAIYKSKNISCIIAFGGGSAIDCAKALGARVAHKGKSLDKLKGNLKIFRKLPPLFAVPTTAGTGSEVTVTAVITDDEKKHKYTMNSFPLIPHFAVLDPKNTYTLPKNLTATTGMDALTHAVEAYIGRSTNKETRALAKDTVKLVFENILIAYNEPENFKARENMLMAAHKAGIAFSKSYVGYVHAVAHSLGGMYNVPHGLANTVLLPIVLEEYGAKIHQKLYELALFSGIAQETDGFEEGARKFISKIKSLNKAMDIPEKIAGIRKEDIPAMANYANREGNPLYPVPRLMDKKELEKLYFLAADWS